MSAKADRARMLRAASRVAQRANIRDIRLFEASAELKGLANSDQLQWDLGVAPEAHYSPGDNYFIITVAYKVTIEEPEDSNAKKDEGDTEEIATISFRFGGLYELDNGTADQEDIKEEEVEAYARTRAVLALYPYAREYVQNVTVRMGLPPLVMDFAPFSAPEMQDSGSVK
jgi:preprotein translocase subunit SecB